MLNNKFKEVIKNLEENISDSDDLMYAKSQVTELSMLFLDELEKIERSFQNRLENCEQKIDILESDMQRLENEFYDVDEESTDLEPIQCPYCNSDFYIEFDSSKKEIICPECQNLIELDWGNFEDDM